MRRDRSAVLHFVSQVVRSIAGFGTTLFAAQYFGASGLGIYSELLAVLFWVKLPGNSIRTAVSKRMSESEAVTGHFTAGALTILGYGTVVGLVIYVFETRINEYFGVEVAALAFLLLATNMFLDISRGGIEGAKRVALSGWLNTLESIIRLLAQIAFALSGAMLLSLVYGHILSMAAITMVGLYFLRERLTIPSLSEFGDLRRFTQYSWLSNVEGVAINWLDLLVLGYFVTDDFIGIYTAVWTLTGFLALAGKSISSTLFPELSQLGSDGRISKARELISDSLLFTGIFLIPGLFGAAVIGDQLLRVYGAEFSRGALILLVLILARTMHTFGRQAINALNGLDYPQRTFRINALFISANLVLNISLVFIFDQYGLGWYGAAIATLLSSCIYFSAGWVVLSAEIGDISFPVTGIGKQIVSSVVMTAVVYTLTLFVPDTLLSAVGLVFVGAAVYGSLLLAISSPIREKVLRVADL
ncbi:oligosaccharide flippase family protein [Haloarcula sp. GH36]|uniref:oligosaccharide flippase family protein n=1 Tax=Haloarcula montana TaxID=3111776 RepID=UPI002D79F578|nr:polysaccharide biosynthesis C-terminal domain-containing protein [Haloarcula sp. GH36]